MTTTLTTEAEEGRGEEMGLRLAGGWRATGMCIGCDRLASRTNVSAKYERVLPAMNDTPLFCRLYVLSC